MQLGAKILTERFIKAPFGIKRPFQLTIALTYRCNSNCKTCNIWKNSDTVDIKKEMELTDYKKLFHELSDCIAWVEFTGGEPTLKKDAQKIIETANNHTSLTSLSITTNSLMPDKFLSIIDGLIQTNRNKKQIIAAISLDGTPELDATIRGGYDHFDKAVSLFARLKKLHYEKLKVHFAYTISTINAGKFEEFYKYVNKHYKIKINEISLTLQHFNANYQNDSPHIPYNDPEFSKGVSQDIKTYSSLRGFGTTPDDLFYHFYSKRIIQYIKHPQKLVIPCAAGRYSAFIDPYGNVYPCITWNHCLGNLKQNHFLEIWNSYQCDQIRNMISGGQCPNCWTPCEAQTSWVANIGPARGWV